MLVVGLTKLLLSKPQQESDAEGAEMGAVIEEDDFDALQERTYKCQYYLSHSIRKTNNFGQWPGADENETGNQHDELIGRRFIGDEGGMKLPVAHELKGITVLSAAVSSMRASS